jgi:hypothetical protein
MALSKFLIDISSWGSSLLFLFKKKSLLSYNSYNIKFKVYNSVVGNILSELYNYHPIKV